MSNSNKYYNRLTIAALKVSIQKFLFVFLVLTTVCLISWRNRTEQRSSNQFIIEGHLNNYQGEEIMLVFNSAEGERVHQVSKVINGKFYISTEKITVPMLCSIQYNGAFYTTLYAAPGYHLVLTADCIDKVTAARTKKVSSYGAQATRFIFKKDSLESIRKEQPDEEKLASEALAVYEEKEKQFKDSLWRVVYAPGPEKIAYSNVFSEKIRLDNIFEKLDKLTWHIAGDTTGSYQQTVDYISRNTDHAILKNLFRSEFLVSDAYRIMMRDGYYVYLKSLRKKTGIRYDSQYYQVDNVKIVAANYTGRIKNITMNYMINNAVLYARSFEELNIYRQGFTPFLTELDSLQNRKLADVFKNRENAVINKQIGRSAPAFKVQDLEKHVHNLEEFKGKVVLLDLWASWCLPCRQQATFIHALYERHKNDDRLKIVSIAVMDHEDAWRKAVDQDRPDWLQLFDANGDVQKAYVANSIPKFILIGKNGNIVSFDAPLPANDAEGLDRLLVAEINK